MISLGKVVIRNSSWQKIQGAGLLLRGRALGLGWQHLEWTSNMRCQGLLGTCKGSQRVNVRYKEAY